MNKQEMIAAIAEKLNITKTNAKAFVDVLPDVIKEGVEKNGKVSLTGFITFERKTIPAKSGVTKLGGVEKPWETPEHDVINVKLSKTYRELI